MKTNLRLKTGEPLTRRKYDSDGFETAASRRSHAVKITTRLPTPPDHMIPKRVLLMDYDARRFAVWRARNRTATEAIALGLFIHNALDALERETGMPFIPNESPP